MSPDVVIVGGGFAGLSAATALAEAGKRVLVLEARPVLGGRASAFIDPATGESVDNGQHVLFGCYHETFRFLHRVGTDGDVELQTALTIDVIDQDGSATRMSCPRLPPPLHLIAGVLRWKALSLSDRLSILRMRTPLRDLRTSAAKPGTPPADDETVRAWLVRHGQSRRLITFLWEPLAVAALNESIDVASAAPFARVLASLLGPGPQDASIGLPRRPLDALYCEPARQYLESRGGGLRCGAKARIPGDGPLRVIVGAEVVETAAVIVAVPWHALPEVFERPTPGLQALLGRAALTPASPIVTVNLWLDRPLPRGPFVGLPGRTFQWVFDKRALFGSASSHVSMVSSGADAIVGQSNGEIASLAWAELSGAMPELVPVPPRRVVVVRERRATFSVAPGSPARPSVETDMAGLYLAGDWIETLLPATIESAVTSGHRAAAAVLAGSGFPPP